jgi:hypothetical protein
MTQDQVSIFSNQSKVSLIEIIHRISIQLHSTTCFSPFNLSPNFQTIPHPRFDLETQKAVKRHRNIFEEKNHSINSLIGKENLFT